MEEKILIKTQKLRFNDLGKILLKISPFTFIFSVIFTFGTGYMANGKINKAIIDEYIAMCFVVCLVTSAIIGIILWPIFRNQLIVSDKRISGKTLFGKSVDLPVDSISAVGTIRLFMGLSISTSSGQVSFLGLSQRDEIYKIISDLIIARQSKTAATPVEPKIAQSNADELKKFKELLDSGVITAEEFDAKKKQILNL